MVWLMIGEGGICVEEKDNKNMNQECLKNKHSRTSHTFSTNTMITYFHIVQTTRNRNLPLMQRNENDHIGQSHQMIPPLNVHGIDGGNAFVDGIFGRLNLFFH